MVARVASGPMVEPNPNQSGVFRYDGFGKALAPMGLELDYEYIRMTRPRIAEMLRSGAEEPESVE